MPFLAPLIPHLPAILGAVGGVAGAIGGGNGGEIDPKQQPALFPDQYRTWFGDWLFDEPQFGQGVAPYPGQPSADMNQTRLPEVFGAWQPMDYGTMHIANQLQNLGIGQQDPRLAQMQQWGGTGGFGHRGMNLAAEYGAPSEGSRGLVNLQQYGVASEGSGRGLANAAQFGTPSSSLGNLVMQQIQGQRPNYLPPMIPARTVGRNA